MPEYKLQAQADEDRLDAEAVLSAAGVQRDIQRSTNYVLAAVLFATTLFFAGMSTKLATPRLRRTLLGLGLIVFVGTTDLDRDLPGERLDLNATQTWVRSRWPPVSRRRVSSGRCRR